MWSVQHANPVKVEVIVQENAVGGKISIGCGNGVSISVGGIFELFKAKHPVDKSLQQTKAWLENNVATGVQYHFDCTIKMIKEIKDVPPQIFNNVQTATHDIVRHFYAPFLRNGLNNKISVSGLNEISAKITDIYATMRTEIPPDVRAVIIETERYIHECEKQTSNCGR